MASKMNTVPDPSDTTPSGVRFEDDPRIEACSINLSNSEQSRVELEIAKAVRTILKLIGEDPDREGLLETPERYARAILFLTGGYDISSEAAINGAIFVEECNDLVLVKDVDISSLCEHHLLPFTGKVHVGYIPNGRLVGLSKVARIAEVYSRRLQVQERLTRQIAEALESVLEPAGITVVLECVHMCMSMRGVRAAGATTITLARKGVFREDADLDKQFHALLGLSRR